MVTKVNEVSGNEVSVYEVSANKVNEVDGNHGVLLQGGSLFSPAALQPSSSARAQLPPPGQQVQVVPGAPGVQPVPGPAHRGAAQRVPRQLAAGQRVQVLPGRVAGGGLREGAAAPAAAAAAATTATAAAGRARGVGVHAAVGGGRHAAVAQRGGPVPVELTGAAALQGRGAAHAVLQDTWRGERRKESGHLMRVERGIGLSE